MKRLLLRRRSAAVLLYLALAGCAIRSNAVSPADSAAYDVLTMAQASLQQANAQLRDGTLPPSALDGYNKAVEAYNETRQVWLDYRNAGGPESKLNESVRAMIAAMGVLNRAAGRLP